MVESAENDVKMPLSEHLEELRWRIIRALIAVAVGFAASYGFAGRLFALLTRPLLASADPKAVELIGTGVAEAFFTKLKVSLIAGVFLASPVILYQAWRFVAPGLYSHEKRMVVPFVIFGTIFFFLGAVFCYLVVFPIGYRFFLEQYTSIEVRPSLRIAEYLSFSSRLLLAFGITFELPVATYFLARVGLVTHRTMIGYARYAIVAMFVLGAALTPPDVASQMLMVAPLALLYLLSIGVAWFAARPR